MKNFIALILRPLILAITLVVGFAAKADKGIETTVELGGYGFTVICHYEPEMHAEVTKIEWCRSDTLRFPTEVEVYGDTFPVTRAVNLQYEPYERYKRNIYFPKVIDLGHLRVFIDKGYHYAEYTRFINNWSLEEVIISEFADTIDATFGGTSIKSIDLKNLKSIGSSFGTMLLVQIEGENQPTQLRSVKMSPYMTEISDKAFSDCPFLEQIDLSNVVKVGKYAFSNTGLKSAHLPKAEMIGEGAFKGSSIESIEINEGVKSVDISAFNNCHNLKSLKLYDAEITYTPRSYNGRRLPIADAFVGMDRLEYIQSSTMEYLGCYNERLKYDLPSLISICNQYSDSKSSTPSYPDMSVRDIPNVKEIYLGNCRIDKLEIGDSLILRYTSNRRDAWNPIQLPNSAIDKVEISAGNHTFYVQDSLLYIRRPVRGQDGLFGEGRGWFESIRSPNSIIYGSTSYYPYPWYKRVWDESGQYMYDTITVNDMPIATVGFPKGEWFRPKSIPQYDREVYIDFMPIPTYCCDFVDKIALGEGTDPSTYRLNTFDREGDKPILVFADLDKVKAEQVLACCLSPLMQFVVPKGKLGRFIAAGFPQDRLIEDVDGTLALDTMGADTEAPARQGIYDISGRRIPSGTPLAPGIYIIDGRKTIIR